MKSKHLTTPLTLGAMLLAGSLTAGGTAYAYEATPLERAELNQLTPQLRRDVEGRLVNGQTVHGVLETMLLNHLSKDFADGHVVATDWIRGTLVVQGRDGQFHAVPFDATTLTIRG